MYCFELYCSFSGCKRTSLRLKLAYFKLFVIIEFWVQTRKLLRIADRYLMKEMIEDYLKQVVYNELCTKNNCMCCLNSLIFAYENGMKIKKREYNFV